MRNCAVRGCPFGASRRLTIEQTHGRAAISADVCTGHADEATASHYRLSNILTLLGAAPPPDIYCDTLPEEAAHD